VAKVAAFGDEPAPMVMPEIKIQEHDVDRPSLQDVQRLTGGAAVGDHLKIRLGGQQATKALAKEDVIIHQQ
jgi:hypothetical protein